MSQQPDEGTELKRPQTAPAHFGIQLRGFESNESAEAFGHGIGVFVKTISQRFDLSQLDGITIAYDYDQALLELDRGYTTSYQLRATRDTVEGIAMTPSVIRNGEVKSHIVINAVHVRALESQDHPEAKAWAVHIFAHECAHVMVTAAFDKAFPGEILQKQLPLLGLLRWNIVSTCWDEYAATNLSAGWGEDQTDKYENELLTFLALADDRANDAIRAYRTHQDVEVVLRAVFEVYGALLKLSAYHLGNLEAFGKKWTEMPNSYSILKGHWFEPFLVRLDAACLDIAKEFGQWADQSSFDVIGDLAQDMVDRAGLHIRLLPENSVHVDIPYTLKTM